MEKDEAFDISNTNSDLILKSIITWCDFVCKGLYFKIFRKLTINIIARTKFGFNELNVK
jgi:hypothetical protein